MMTYLMCTVQTFLLFSRTVCVYYACQCNSFTNMSCCWNCLIVNMYLFTVLFLGGFLSSLSCLYEVAHISAQNKVWLFLALILRKVKFALHSIMFKFAYSCESVIIVGYRQFLSTVNTKLHTARLPQCPCKGVIVYLSMLLVEVHWMLLCNFWTKCQNVKHHAQFLSQI